MEVLSNLGNKMDNIASKVRETEYDCEKKRRRWHKVSLYSGLFGTGAIVASYHSAAQWDQIEAHTMGNTLLAAICSKRSGGTSQPDRKMMSFSGV